MKLLLVFGANPVQKNKDGHKPMDVAKFQTISTFLESVSAVYQSAKREEVETVKGDRMLFLDGGGMRGLVEIEILMEIERRTGHRITELFDWIVGTSIGGVIAMALVYGEFKCILTHWQV